MELVLEMSLMFKEVQLKLPMLVPYSFFSKKNILENSIFGFLLESQL